jgi:hypothetical protein
MHPSSYDPTEPTHPPYAVRHGMLVRVMNLLNWHKPITNSSHNEIHQAEKEFVHYILEDPYYSWADVFNDSQLTIAIIEIQKYLSHMKS